MCCHDEGDRLQDAQVAEDLRTAEDVWRPRRDIDFYTEQALCDRKEFVYFYIGSADGEGN